MSTRTSTAVAPFVPEARRRYLAEVAEAVRGYHARTAEQVEAVRAVDQLAAVRDRLAGAGRATADVDELLEPARGAVDPDVQAVLEHYSTSTCPSTVRPGPPDPHLAVGHRGAPHRPAPRHRAGPSSSASCGPRTCPATSRSPPGCSPTERDDEDPTRMFAGEGGPAKTNARFHYLAAGQPATRLSVAFDSVTLYGADPDERPDIYGKVGNSGVSVATLDDMADPVRRASTCATRRTSVSMTINGPAPAILAMYLATAIDQHPELEPGGGAAPGPRHGAGRHPQGGPGPEHLHPRPPSSRCG